MICHMSHLILPGIIDPHVHLRDPGQIEKEDFFTGTQAALAGGYTTLLDMPNNKIPITTEELLNEKIQIAKEKIVCDIGFYFGSLGDNFDEFAKVQDKVFGLKLFLNQTTGGFIIDKEKLEKIYRAWPGIKPILVHAEEEMLEQVIQIVDKTRKKTHICHISSRFELQRIILAKEKGLPITCGITPHHLFLTEDDEKMLGPYGKMKPPLRKRSDVDFLWSNINAIDLVESDHAPHTKEEKESDNTVYGVPGLETTLPLLLTAVHDGKLTLEDITKLCFENPTKIFGVPQNKGTYIEVEKDYEYEITNENLFTKCKWTPFDGWRVKGKVRTVVMRGKTAFADNKVRSKPGEGHILTSTH